MADFPRTLIAGWYGNGNVGDEAILHGIARAVRAHAEGYPLTAFSASPSHTAATAPVKATRRSLPLRGSQLFVEIATLAVYRFYVLGGGGLLKDMGGRSGNCHRWLWPVRAAQLAGKTTMTYAIGAEMIEFEASKRIIRSTLDRCELVTVRDPASSRLLKDIGVRANIVVTADPAVLLQRDDAPRVTVDHPEPMLAVTLRHWFTSSYHVDNPGLVDRLHGEVARALDRLVAEFNARVLFVPFREDPIDDDRVICGDVAALMRFRERATITSVPSPEQAAEHFRAASFAIGMRLHSTILAAAAATPFVAIGYMPKVRDFLQHAGTPDALIELSDANSTGAIENKIVESFRARHRARQTLLRTMPLHRKLAHLNGEMLVALAMYNHARLRRCVAQSVALNVELHSTNG
jgi:polysaccharide pyruvyl transferase CsaB